MNSHPVRIEGELQAPLSRWLWLVKWFLLIPHILILIFLWIAFILTTIGTFFVMLFTGRYPRGIFDFNLGVLRWTWRVAFYSYSSLATDRYPPFSRGEEPDYPARLYITYPSWQRKGLPLIGWWLIGIPQYAIAAVLVGWEKGPGAVGILVFVAAMLLLFKNHYRQDVFDLVMGFNRYGMRVCAYLVLMTPQYPPFRFDPGAREPESGGAGPTLPPVAPPVAG